MFSTLDYKRKIADQETMTLSFDDQQMMESIGYDLTSKLDVDAVLIIYYTIYQPKEVKIMLQNANMIMLGKNPRQLAEGEKKPMFYRKGQLYCATRFQPDAQIYNYKEKDPKTHNLDPTGFNNIALSLGKVMCEYLKYGKD